MNNDSENTPLLGNEDKKEKEEKYTCSGGVCMLNDMEHMGTPLQSSNSFNLFIPTLAEISALESPVINIPEVKDSQLTIKINPEKVPQKFTRYRHPSHQHKLFMLTGLIDHRCDNLHCRRLILGRETIFSCFRCNFDLCDICFQLSGDVEVPLSREDKDVDENTVRPLSTFLNVVLDRRENNVAHDDDCDSDDDTENGSN